jgi:hypothetical protein
LKLEGDVLTLRRLAIGDVDDLNQTAYCAAVMAAFDPSIPTTIALVIPVCAIDAVA